MEQSGDRTETEAGRVRLRVYGGVQGVGFRVFVLRAARGLGLDGHVFNRADGSVELEAGGPADALDTLRRTVGNGPRAARVERVEALEPGTARLSRPFEIREG